MCDWLGTTDSQIYHGESQVLPPRTQGDKQEGLEVALQSKGAKVLDSWLFGDDVRFTVEYHQGSKHGNADGMS